MGGRQLGAGPRKGPARVWRGREQESAGQYQAQGFLSPSSRLSAWPKWQCQESGSRVCLAAMISGWSQLPNTVPHHHPQYTHGTSQKVHPQSQNGVGGEWGRLAGLPEARGQAQLSPLPISILSPSQACIRMGCADWVSGFIYAFQSTRSPSQTAHCSSHVRKAEDRILPCDSHSSSVPVVLPLLTPFQQSAGPLLFPSLGDGWVAGLKAEAAPTQPHLPVF